MIQWHLIRPGLNPASPSAADSTSSSLATPPGEGPTFMTTMSNMRFVGPAIRVYEQTKASSTIVKYGAEMMEGTVMTMTKPVIDRLPVTQLNEFAERQLDRLGMLNTPPVTLRTEESSAASLTIHTRPDTPTQAGRGRKHLWIDDEDEEEPSSKRRSLSRDSTASLSGTLYSGSVSSGAQTRYPYQPSEASSSTHWQTILQAQDEQALRLRNLQSRGEDCREISSYERASSGQEIQVASRSKWQAVLLEAGGIGAAVSEESMKRLKYCLHWLQVGHPVLFVVNLSLIYRNVPVCKPSHRSANRDAPLFHHLNNARLVSLQLFLFHFHFHCTCTI